jgi:hypothetical protein
MKETAPDQEVSSDKDIMIGRFRKLAIELHESGKAFEFPGMDPEAEKILKEEQDEFFLNTPIDKLIEKFQKEGMRITLSPGTQEVFVVPAISQGIELNSVHPGDLDMDETNDEDLMELVYLGQWLKVGHNEPYKRESPRRENIKEEIANIAREIIESGEILPFPGFTIEGEKMMRRNQEESGMTRGIDELIQNFERYGVRIYIGPNNQNIFALPAHIDESNIDEVQENSVLLKDFDIDGADDERLIKLIELSQGYRGVE